jgi:hypothetical protein
MYPKWQFQDFRVGVLFHFDGEDYCKQSSRTARQLSTGRTVYIKQLQLIHRIAY